MRRAVLSDHTGLLCMLHLDAFSACGGLVECSELRSRIGNFCIRTHLSICGIVNPGNSFTATVSSSAQWPYLCLHRGFSPGLLGCPVVSYSRARVQCPLSHGRLPRGSGRCCMPQDDPPVSPLGKGSS
ncbi:hypothetical protein BD414DRAFT_486430 [Trametes punicea]|nr:hypothetical protein BD414DRAFT_486430 [Trametes punicea]